MRGFHRHCGLRDYLFFLGMVIYTIYVWGRSGQQITKVIVLASSKAYSKFSEFRGFPRLQEIPDCSCSKKFFYPPNGDFQFRLNSSYSDEASIFHENQKVCYLLLLRSLKFLNEGNFRIRAGIRGRYPGKLEKHTEALFRILDSDLHKHLIVWPLLPDGMQPLRSILVQCENTPSYGDLEEVDFRAWRFLPLGDHTVDVFLSRNLDSLMSGRKSAVVWDWLSKGEKAISVVRDREKDHDTEILGGGWQANNTLLGRKVAS